jgi:predicted HD phosphohydrolase
MIGARSPLAEPDWRYVEKPELRQFRAADWDVLGRQRREFYSRLQAEHVLRLLRGLKDDPSWGYEINAFQHCLQSATMVMQDGHDEETIVVALLHDVGFTLCPDTHGAFAAALLAPYVDERHVWMLERHGIFQNAHAHEHPDADPAERERWRGHPHFAWAADYVEHYDQNAIRADYPTAPLAHFEPMVHRLLARPARKVILD